jgi:hypothetical protein
MSRDLPTLKFKVYNNNRESTRVTNAKDLGVTNEKKAEPI